MANGLPDLPPDSPMWDGFAMATFVYACSANHLFGHECTLFVPTWRDRDFPVRFTEERDAT